MIHQIVGRIEGAASVAGGCGHKYDWVTRTHYADTVPDKSTFEIETHTCCLGQFFHSREGQGFIVREFEGADTVTGANLAKE